MRWMMALIAGVVLSSAPDRDARAAGAACVAPPVRADAKAGGDDDRKPVFTAKSVWTAGSVTIGGKPLDYCAVAGTLVVHPAGWDDSAPEPADKDEDSGKAAKTVQPVASMFYAAYLRRDAGAARPITFLFNGGPGSSSIWLHMGAFGPKRVATGGATHVPPAPYTLEDNAHSLLDVSDLVFIDAPGTGFSRIAGEGKEAAFYGVDEDAHAFAAFIARFLTQYQRWNSPKYLFGESYGTTRAAVLVNLLQDNPGIDFNGVVMLSQVLASGFYPDRPKDSPGNDLPYQLSLPSYAATAWYHLHPDTPVPPVYLPEVERFAMGDYAAALAAGANLDAAARAGIAAKLHDYTGLPVEYLDRSDLRVDPDEFRQELLRGRGLIVGATDTRFAGHALDRTGKKAGADPSDAAIGSAYVSSFNDYVRRVLKYTEDRAYRPQVDDIADQWDFQHEPPGGAENEPASRRTVNVMTDLAHAMKTNPLLKVQLNAGYFDLLTPYFQGRYEMAHLPIPADLRGNIEYRSYPSGHLVYLTRDSQAALHDNVADFIRRTSAPVKP